MKLVEKLAIELGMGPKGCKEREEWNKAHPLEFEALDREEWFAAVGFVEGFRKALDILARQVEEKADEFDKMARETPTGTGAHLFSSEAANHRQFATGIRALADQEVPDASGTCG